MKIFTSGIILILFLQVFWLHHRCNNLWEALIASQESVTEVLTNQVKSYEVLGNAIMSIDRRHTLEDNQ